MAGIGSVLKRRVTQPVVMGLHSIISPKVQTLSPSGTDLAVQKNDDGTTVLQRVPIPKELNRRETMKLLPVGDPTKFHKKDMELKAHGVRESLFHSRSEFTDFRGFVNLGLLLLFANCIRIAIENIQDYGVLADIYPLVECMAPWPLTLNKVLMISLNVFVILAILFEKLASNYSKAHTRMMSFVKICHWTNISVGIILPCVIVWSYRPPIIGAFLVIAQATIVWMKLISYVAVNQHYRTRNAKSDGGHSSRNSSRASREPSKDVDRNSDTQSESSQTSGMEEGKKIRYPENINFADMYYFMGAPTLCYELNFPRTDRIRRGFLFRRIAEVVLLAIIITSLIQQWIIPLVDNTYTMFDGSISMIITRTLKLAVPNNAIWLTCFYMFFHAYLNAWAEILRFGDRQFYRDWWNAPNIPYFWSNWNIPVHKWMARHVYRPLRARGMSKLPAVALVFALSAVLHEVVVGIPLGLIKGYAIAGMLSYVPLASLTDKLYEKTNMSPAWGNVIVWLSLLIGQPAGVLLYAHDYRVANS